MKGCKSRPSTNSGGHSIDHAVRLDRTALGANNGVAMPTVRCPVLIGRDPELWALEDALLAANRGESRLVLLQGEAGMGKTRLTEEIASRARKLGCAVLRGSCSEAEVSLPYLPFVEAIGNWLADAGAGAVADRLGPLRDDGAALFPVLAADGGSPQAPDATQAKARLFEALVALLSMPAADRGLALVVEDVHWADAGTREFLDFLSRRLVTQRAMVLVTCRSDELHRKHPVVPLVRSWERSRLAAIVTLKPLPPESVRAMIGSIFSTTEVSDEFATWMHERVEGNPFVLEEMLKEAVDRGDIYRTASGWDRKPLAEISVPDSVRHLILLRLERLAPAHAEVLRVAAVLGRTFDDATLAEVSGAGDEVVRDTLAEAVRHQLVEEELDAGNRFRWRHALTQEAVYSDLVGPVRRGIHSRAADALARSGRSPVELTAHLLAAARFEEATRAARRAAEDAERAFAYEEAASLYERATEGAGDDLQRARLLCLTGRAYAMAQQPSNARAFLEEGVRQFETCGERLDAARFRVWLSRSWWDQSRTDVARKELEAALPVLQDAGPSAELALALRGLAALHAFALEPEACADAAERAVAVAREAGDDFHRVWAQAFLLLGLMGRGDVDAALHLFERTYREAASRGFMFIVQNACWNDVWLRCRLMLDGLDEARARIDELLNRPEYRMQQLSTRSYVALVRGDPAAAVADAREVEQIAARVGHEKFATRMRLQAAEALLEAGRIEEASAAMPPLSWRVDPQDVVYDAGAQIRLRLADGRVADAGRLGLEIVADIDRFAGYRETVAAGVEGLVAAGRLDEAERAVAVSAAHRMPAGRAWLDEAAARVLLARGDAAAAVPRALAAVEEADRLLFRLVALRGRVLLAGALAQAGDRDEAQRVLARALSDAAAMGAGRLAAHARAVAAETGLAVPAADEPPAALESGAGRRIPAGERVITSLFADVRGYTPLTARTPPAQMAETMGGLWRSAKQVVERHQGIVDKFAGDAVMATFNVEGADLDHTVHALRAAFELRDRAALADLTVGIGIGVGPAVVGHLVSDGDVSAIGVGVNLAARLQASAKAGEILMSEEAHRRVQGWLVERGIEADRDTIALKGFDEPQVAYRIVAHPPLV